ncbi:MAG TPA: EamA family transporter [Acetobacteraceae bacterium]|jgi:drug/metabolite transporter (DMT)-like permease|nr:EamA family transporter [Acetobacteraceae bacterium]
MTLSPAARQRAMFLTLCFVWGTTWLAMKVGIATVPPGIFAGTRWTVAGLILLGIRKLQGEPIRATPRIAGRLIVVALLMVTLNQVIQLYGLKWIAAGLAAVINSALTPIALLAFAVASRQERFSPRQLAGMAVGVLGIFVLFGPAAFDGTLDLWTLLGAITVVIACLSYSAGSVMARRLMLNLAPGQMSGLTNLIGGVILLMFSIPLEPGAGEALRFHWGWPAFLAWLYLLLPGAVLATTIYFQLVHDWGASRTGTYAFVSPIVAVVLGALLFGEHVTGADLAGMSLMLAAAALALPPRPAKPRAKPPVRAGLTVL